MINDEGTLKGSIVIGQGPRGDKGEKGDRGEPGIGIQGPKGDKGDRGEKGEATKIWFSDSDPVYGEEKPGDIHINRTNWNVYYRNEDEWEAVETLKGERGSLVHTGPGEPGEGIGNNQDLFINTSTGDIYNKRERVWILEGSLRGPEGPQGPDGPPGDNTAEILEARGSFNKLGERLDTVNTQLEHKANYNEVRLKSVKNELEDMSSTVLSAIQGGEGTSFNLLSIPQNESVTMQKLADEILSGFLLETKKMSKDIITTTNPIAGATGVFSLSSSAEATKSGYLKEINLYARNIGTITFYIGSFDINTSTFTKRVAFDVAISQTGLNNVSLNNIYMQKGEYLGMYSNGVIGLYSNDSNVSITDFYYYKATTTGFSQPLVCNKGTSNTWMLYNFDMEIIIDGENEKLTNDIKGTKQVISFNIDGTVGSIKHNDTKGVVLREDTFSYETNKITEIRTLYNGKTIKYVYNLDTLETEVI